MLWRFHSTSCATCDTLTVESSCWGMQHQAQGGTVQWYQVALQTCDASTWMCLVRLHSSCCGYGQDDSANVCGYRRLEPCRAFCYVRRQSSLYPNRNQYVWGVSSSSLASDYDSAWSQACMNSWLTISEISDSSSRPSCLGNHSWILVVEQQWIVQIRLTVTCEPLDWLYCSDWFDCWA